MKKLISLVLCLMMVLSIGAVASAEEADHVKLSLQSYDFAVGGDFSDPNFSILDSLKVLADAGYEGLEWCGFMNNSLGIDAADLAAAYKDAGLEVTGYHFHMGSDIEADAKTAVERCVTLGCDKLIFAYSTPASFGIAADENGEWTAEQVDEWAAKVNEVLATLKKAAEGTDIKVMYHNHADEFRKGTDGRYMLDMLECDGIEVDVYWSSKNVNTGYSVDYVLNYVRENKDKVLLLHVKDGLAGSKVTGEMCGWGKGTFDIQAIIDTAKECGIESVIVENDNPSSFGLTGLTDALESAEYAKTLNFAK